MPPGLTLDIQERRSFADGQAFAETGPYERLTGRARFLVDPQADDFPSIVDLEHAPRDDEGLVAFSADLCILRPVDRGSGNRRLFFEYVNRGNKRALQFFNDAVHSDRPLSRTEAGNGFLMRRGYSIVWMGWQGDLYPGSGRMLLEAPVARKGNAPITGWVRAEYIAAGADVRVFPLSSLAVARSYPALSLDPRKATLTRRRYAESARQEIPPNRWQFARLEQSRSIDGVGLDEAIVPSDSHLFLPEGFDPGWIYELIYEARDPLVLGLGQLAVRELVSFLKHDGSAANPLGPIEKAYGWGRSQSGRCLRDFVYRGFNADAAGRKVFDGILPHVAGGGKLWLNHRFANAAILPGQEYENHQAPVDLFPFSYASSTDHLTGKRDAILKRPESDPLVIHTDSASEYWHRRASLVHSDTSGQDLAQPEGVRLYLWASSQHFAAPGFSQPNRGQALYLQNGVATSAFFRANLDRMDRWVTDGEEPPPSLVPRRDEGTLVTPEEWRAAFPAIPGVALPKGPSALALLDYGAEFDRGLLSEHPPRPLGDGRYAVLVPMVDPDGNEVAGLRAPMVRVPLGTYTGWNLRRAENGQGAMIGITGCYLPFPETAEQRLQTGDPRLSILERYRDSADYLARMREAVEALVAAGFLLEEDVARIVEMAAGWNAGRHCIDLPSED